MTRATGSYAISATLGESMRAFVPHPLPPADPALSCSVFADCNRQAELALARLCGVSGLVPSVDWLLYSAIRKEALLTSQREGTLSIWPMPQISLGTHVTSLAGRRRPN